MMLMARVLITGGTGLIGRRLSQLLRAKGYEVITLTRGRGTTLQDSDAEITKSGYAYWNTDKGEISRAAIGNTTYIIHLAGAGVAEKRWTEKRKKQITESRTQSSALLVNALSKWDNPVRAVISASAIGWYGADTAESLRNGFREEHLPAADFLGNTCRLWEESIGGVEKPGTRLVKLRTGIVLSSSGGALAGFLLPLKARIAAILGSGDQYINAMESDQLSGVYNAVAPVPVTNKELTLTLAKVKCGRAFIRIFVPGFLLKLVLGEMSIEVLKSTKVSCEKILGTSFAFNFPTVEAALKDITGNP
jgi:uncharacterized protein (TIGR01777 family)